MINGFNKIGFTKHTRLAYLSTFNDEITSLLISLAEGALKSNETLQKSSNKVGFLIAESFQNIVRHGTPDLALKEGIEEFKDYYQIDIFNSRVLLSSANIIQHELVEDLITRINMLNSLSQEELKALKKKVLVDGTMSAKGGANLGLIELIRKSGTPLKSHFQKLNEKFSQVFMSTEMIKDLEKKEEEIDIAEIVQQYQLFSKECVVFYYSGDFSKKSNIPIIEMLHKNIIDDKNNTSSGIESIITIIEIIQNVSKHGLLIDGVKSGMLVLKNASEGQLLSCSNYIASNEVAELELKLKFIKESSMDVINKLYHERLAGAEISAAGNSGLGLFEIAKITGNSFNYWIKKSDSGRYVFTIELLINQ